MGGIRGGGFRVCRLLYGFICGSLWRLLYGVFCGSLCMLLYGFFSRLNVEVIDVLKLEHLVTPAGPARQQAAGKQLQAASVRSNKRLQHLCWGRERPTRGEERTAQSVKRQIQLENACLSPKLWCLLCNGNIYIFFYNTIIQKCSIVFYWYLDFI